MLTLCVLTVVVGYLIIRQIEIASTSYINRALDRMTRDLPDRGCF